MNQENKINGIQEQENVADMLHNAVENACVSYDEKCCGHCRYYDSSDSTCSDGKPVRPTDWCSSFTWAY